MSKPAKILLVDDDNEIRAVLGMLLRGSGFDVLEASNGLEGLQLLARHSFDLVLTDVSMPEKDGLTMISEAATVAPRVKFLVHSGSDRETLERAKQLSSGRIVAVFRKPTPFSEIVAEVKGALLSGQRGGRDDVERPGQERDAFMNANPFFGEVHKALHYDQSLTKGWEFDTVEPSTSARASAFVARSL